MTDFVKILNAIEDSLAGEIDVNELAKSAKMSVYEFRRIFSFVVGVPVSEYIRKRRLSIAAEDILSGGLSVTEAAMKYQYDDPSSFTRAFKEFHGVSPSELLKGKASLKMYTKVDFHLQVGGGENVECRIYEAGEYFVNGFAGVSQIEDKECCERVWQAFENAPVYDEVVEKSGGKLYAAYVNGDNEVSCCIGKRTEGAEQGLDFVKIPPSAWAAFRLTTTEDELVNGYYGNVICKWLDSSTYCRNEGLPNLEIFPADMSKEGFEWEIHIPIKRK